MSSRKEPTIEDLRTSIAETRARIDTMAEDRARVTVDELRDRIQRRLTASRHGAIASVLAHQTLENPGTSLKHIGETPLTLGDLADLLGVETVRDRIVEMLADQCGEVPHELRTAERESAVRELFDLEVQEVAAVTTARAGGRAAHFRADTDPAAALEAWR